MAGKYLSLLVHFTWSTKGREPWLETEIRQPLFSYIGGILNNKKAKLISAGGMFDHIHLYASMPSTISVVDFVNVVKSNSSRWVHESYPQLRNFAWQEGYGAFSVSKSGENRVINYVRNQEEAPSQTNVQGGIDQSPRGGDHLFACFTIVAGNQRIGRENNSALMSKFACTCETSIILLTRRSENA